MPDRLPARRAAPHLRRSILGLSFLGGAVLCAPAVASAASLKDPDPVAPVAVPQPAPSTWTGRYFGGHIAYVAHEASFDGAFSQFGSANTQGGALGVQFGAQVQRGLFVAGVEVDFSRLEADGKDILRSGLDDLTFRVDITQLASARVRFGVAQGNALAFLTAGLGWMKGDVSLRSSTGSAVDASGVHDFGVVYGGGFDWRLWPTASLRTEVLHYAFDKTFTTTGGDRVGVDLGTTVVRSGINVHF